jgi:phosphatidylserine/phosphatidylglycerophosphate/cardiolipin synthase-like enzyme
MHEAVDLGFDVLLSDGKNPGGHGVMHHKFVVIDAGLATSLVVTGSFNWTMNGELNNFENAVYLDAPDDVAAWAEEFRILHAQARAPAPEDRTRRHDDSGLHDAVEALAF